MGFRAVLVACGRWRCGSMQIRSILVFIQRCCLFLKIRSEVVRCLTELAYSLCVCLLLQYLIQSCARGGRRIVEDMCYEIRRTEACVD
jgi:hypothetical protein